MPEDVENEPEEDPIDDVNHSEVSIPPDVDSGSDPSIAKNAASKRSIWLLRLLDLLLFLVLASASLPVRFHFTHGDLFSDEADYALSSTSGFQANRYDRSSSSRDIIKSRHYHAPFTVEIIQLARRWGSDDRTVRTPFVIAGGISVGLVYLCGVLLFEGRREIAIACAVITIFTTPVIRMASHALPWSLIILELLLILWTLVAYAQSRKPAWLVAALGSLGLLFVTSEMFFVVVPAVVIAAPFLFWDDRSDRAALRRIGSAIVIGVVGMALIALILWPAGLSGDAVLMLKHYIGMSHSEEFPVNIGPEIYSVAPKWAYLYWYWNDYRPFFLWYVAGIPPFLVMLPFKRLPAGGSVLLILTGLIVGAAHGAHIIGPEYLAHCLPFLTLVGGYLYFALARIWRPLGIIGIVVATFYLAQWRQVRPLPGMDRRAQISRWTAASHFLASRWRPTDRLLLGPQPVDVVLWYLPNVGGAAVRPGSIGPLRIHDPPPAFLKKLTSGYIRYVVVSSAFEDAPDVDVKTRRILKTWRVVWSSDEHRSGPSRLIVYEAPYPRSRPSLPHLSPIHVNVSR